MLSLMIGPARLSHSVWGLSFWEGCGSSIFREACVVAAAIAGWAGSALFLCCCWTEGSGRSQAAACRSRVLAAAKMSRNG